MVAAVQSRMAPAPKPPAPAGAMPAQPPLRLQARADTAYSTDWTPDEQVALDAALDKFPASRHSALERYLRAAAALKKKTVRDVALRVRWLATTSSATKRRLADDSAGKKRPRVQSIFAVQPRGAPPLVPPPAVATGVPATGVPAPFLPPAQPGLAPPGEDGGAGGTVEGPMAQLLEQNYLILNQYKQNMQQYKVHENTELLVRFRDNILTILGQMSGMAGLMQHMPPLPVRLNVELASNFLPKAGTYPVTGQPVFTAPPAAGGQFPAGGGVAAVVPVGGQAKAAAKQESKASSQRSKSKSGSKRSSAPAKSSDDRPGKPRSELRVSARRAAQKAQPSRSTELRSSARLAAAADSEQS